MSTPTPGSRSPLEDAKTAGALLRPGSDVTGLDVTGLDAAVPVGRRRAGGFADVARRYRRNRLAVVGLVVVVILAVVALFEPWLTPYDPLEQNLGNTLQQPSADHWFGTDVLGRDLYSGIIYGTRLAMLVSALTVLCSLVIGVVFGALAGVKGGAWDAVVSRVIDVFLAFPLLIGAVIIVRAVGGGIVPVVVALVALGWMTTARLMRGQVLALREAEYVEAARSIGAGNGRIVVRHILPNAIAPVLVYAFTSIGVVVVAMASLSYLGIGAPVTEPEWGRLISQATPFLQVPGMTHLWLAPAGAIAVTTLAFAFVADGLRDALDPRLRGG
jgi:peptide/nickel transport system permease protein